MFGIKFPWTKRKERKEAEARLNVELRQRASLRLVSKPGMRGDTRHNADTSAPYSYSGGSSDDPYFSTGAAIGLVEMFSSRSSASESMSGGGGTFDGGGSSGDWSSSSSDSSSCSSDSSSSSSDSSSSCGSDN